MSFLLLTGNSEGKETGKDPNKEIIASVGSYNITLSGFSSRYVDYLIGAGVNDNNMIRESILNNIINEVVLYNFDDNSRIFTDTEYQRELKSTQKETILAYLKDQEVYKNITASDDEIRDAFVRVNEMVAARHLYAKTKEEADELYEQLKSGVGFDVLAKQVFTDSVLKNNGGYLGYFTWGDMDPAFEDAAFSLKIGEISRPVKTANGYSIIKVENKVVKPLLTENEYLNKKDHLAQVVRMRKMKPAERAYVKSIMDLEKIKFNEQSVNSVFSNLNFSEPQELKKIGDKHVECASYEGKKYLQFNIENEIRELPLYQKNKIKNTSDLKAVIKGIFLRDTLDNIAVAKGYDTVSVVKQTFKKLVTDLFMRYKTVEVMKKSSVPDSVVYAYYKENIKNFSSPREISVKELVVNNKTLADSLRIYAEKSVDFDKFIKEYSLKENDGDNEFKGYTDLDEYGSIKDSLWNSSLGNIAGPFNIDDHFVLFKIIGKKDGKPLELDLIKDRVAALVKKEIHDSLLRKYAENLRKSVKIKINYDILWSYKVPGLSYK